MINLHLWISLESYTPEFTNIDTKHHDALEDVYVLSNMAMFGSHVRFQGCNMSPENQWLVQMYFPY